MASKSLAMYGISRIDDEVYRTHAWRVSLRRRGKAYVRNFADLKCGGKRKALAMAKKYRDELLERHQPLTRKEFADILRGHNRTGITGVYRYVKTYYLKDGTERETWYWEAHWPTVRGGSEKASFSVKVYGERGAKARAVQARQEGLKRVEGYFWASERGVARPDAAVKASPKGAVKAQVKTSRQAAPTKTAALKSVPKKAVKAAAKNPPSRRRAG